MAKTVISEKIKRELPDPKAFSRFKDFTRRILAVRKDDIKNTDSSDSRLNDPTPADPPAR